MKNLAILLAALTLGACTQIDTGNVGVERTLGKVSEQPLPPGIYQTVTKTVDEYTTKEVPLILTDLKPKSSDNLTMADVDIDVYFKVAPEAMAKLYIKYQGDVSRVYRQSGNQMVDTGEEIVGMGRVLREARESVFRAIAQFPATTMHTKRDEIAAKVLHIMQEELDKTDKGSFIITNVNVKSLVTDPALEEAIRERARVDQQIEAKLKQNELAKAEAARLLIEAQGLTAADLERARGLTPQVLELKRLQVQESIGTRGGNTSIMIPYGQPTIMNMK